MFLFDVIAELEGKLCDDQMTLLFEDEQKESLQLVFRYLDEIDIATINNVQKPIFVDLKQGATKLLRE